MNAKVMGAAAALLLASAAQAAPFQNGGFESGDDPGSYTGVSSPDSAAITGWTVYSGTIDYIGDYWTAAEGSRSVDLNGTTAGAISQTFDTVAGHVYRVSFSLAGNPDDTQNTLKTVRVLAPTGGTPADYNFDTSDLTRGYMGWVSRTYTFTATSSSTTLSFSSLTEESAYGPAIDNVTVTDVTPTSVPTLSQWALFSLAGLLGLAALRRRGLRG